MRSYSVADINFICSVNGLFLIIFVFACDKTANFSVLGLFSHSPEESCNISNYNVIYWLCRRSWVTIYVQTESVQFL